MTIGYEAHRQYRWLLHLKRQRVGEPKPSLVIKEIPDAERDKQNADQPLTPED